MISETEIHKSNRKLPICITSIKNLKLIVALSIKFLRAIIDYYSNKKC